MALGCDKIQGSFISNGESFRLNIPIGVNTATIYNYTQSTAATPQAGVEFYWQEGMPDQGGIMKFKDGSDALLQTTNFEDLPGFSFFDFSEQTFSNPRAVTGVTDAELFEVTTDDIRGLVNGDIVMLYDTNTTFNTRGFMFQVANVTPTGGDAGTFTIAYDLANVPGGVSTEGFYRIYYGGYKPFYPRTQTIIDILPGTGVNAGRAVVTTSIASDYKVGQTVRFTIPTGFGMTELNGLSGTITSVDDATAEFVVAINVSNFTPFTWIESMGGGFTFASVTPAYMDTAYANQQGVDPYSDARTNEMERGLLLYGGAFGPAGQDGDLIFWTVESSTTVYPTETL